MLFNHTFADTAGSTSYLQIIFPARSAFLDEPRFSSISCLTHVQAESGHSVTHTYTTCLHFSTNYKPVHNHIYTQYTHIRKHKHMHRHVHTFTHTYMYAQMHAHYCNHYIHNTNAHTNDTTIYCTLHIQHIMENLKNCYLSSTQYLETHKYVLNVEHMPRNINCYIMSYTLKLLLQSNKSVLF